MKDPDDNLSRTKSKRECDYGEKCYRKNPAHFEEYEHCHLNTLLKQLKGKNLQILPADYKPKISTETVKEQLKILRSLYHNSENEETISEVQTQNNRLAVTEHVATAGKLSPNGNSSFPSRKRQILSGDKDLGNTSPVPNKRNSYSKKEEPSSSGSTRESKGSKGENKTPSSSAISSGEHQKKMQSARNMGQAMAFMQEVKKRSQGNILDKHKAAAPYYFFLTSITDSKKTHTEHLSLQLFDILDPALGDLESSLQINFMVEFGWLMAQYLVAKQGGKPITLLYGEMDVANLSFPHITSVRVKPPSPFGSHHTKMCVLAYKDGSVRVCVHTANLVESDWDNRVQGVWLSPACPAVPLDADSTAGESPTNFKQDLIQYLSAYRLAELQPWIGKLRRADFTHINVFFVASTPGSHKDVDSNKWGHKKLASLLKKHVQIKPEDRGSLSKWQIIAQCSSIGSLGPQPTSWFCGEIKQSLSCGLGFGMQCPPPLRLVYPSFENVAGSHDGLLGGGCLPYSKKVHDKQPWLQQYLFQWKSDRRHRTKAVPHIKTYTCVSPDLSKIVWFHLTSANMSKAAWGCLSKAGANNILSYEAGVLFLPQFVVGSPWFPIKKESACDIPVFPMPYDLPLTQYSSQDIPWFMDNLS